MLRKAFLSITVASGLFLGMSAQGVAASSVNINAPDWLGPLNLPKEQLGKIKEAFETALNSPIDSEQQCGAVYQDCEVRAAREWSVGNDFYREMVINIHTVGHTSHAVKKEGDKWPSIVAK